MKIPFHKITPSPKQFSIKRDDKITLECELSKIDRTQVSLKGRIKGLVSLDCDRCGAEFNQEIDWPLELILSSVVVKDAKDLDIIEFVNSDIDFNAILEGELNSYRLLYHYCDRCQADGDKELDLEF